METTLKEFLRHSNGGFKARLLASSIMANDAGQVRALLAAGVSIHCHPYDYDTPLIWAISLRKTSCVRVLLEAGAPVVPSPTSKDPVTVAVERGSLAIVRMLLQHGAAADLEPTKEGDFSALELAVLSGRADLVAQLCRAGADPDRAIKRCFALGAWSRRLPIGPTFTSVLQCARKGESPGRRTPTRRTVGAAQLIAKVPVLLAAVACRSSAVADALLLAGADRTATDSDGCGIEAYSRPRTRVAK